MDTKNTRHAKNEVLLPCVSFMKSIVFPPSGLLSQSHVLSLHGWVWACGWLLLALGVGGPGSSGASGSSSGLKTSHEIPLDQHQRHFKALGHPSTHFYSSQNVKLHFTLQLLETAQGQLAKNRLPCYHVSKTEFKEAVLCIILGLYFYINSTKTVWMMMLFLIQ
ncbi:hypothetical protein Q5P01_016887 [Channa striata]|uniref:Uncharacterized protein n=1 Tax=Channa striata TaxID=64152 RepID=A0AA88M934_CHASR|nr:hypothetical protein Q5P01_016887 [Channa striata]